VAFFATFLLALGLLQWVSIVFELRGVSLSGSKAGFGIIFVLLLLLVGIWLALTEPLVRLLAFAIPSFVLAVIVLAMAGILTNLKWDPTRQLLNPQDDEGWVTTQMGIPVMLVHLASAKQSRQQMIPATFMQPKCTLPARPAVLVICGAGDSRMSFKWHLFGELLANGIAVLTIDPPGHGDFQQVPITTANALAAGRAAIQWLHKQPGIERIGVCGISLGGCQAAALAAEDQTIQAVALISTPVQLEVITRRTYALETLALLALPRNLGLLRDGSLLTLWHEWHSLRGAMYGESLYDMVRIFDARTSVHTIGNRPILIVHGSHDHAIPLHNAQVLYEAAVPLKEMLVIRQANHVSPVLYPREMKILATWFAKWLNYNRLDAQQAVQT
jgi:esterase/lipase